MRFVKNQKQRAANRDRRQFLGLLARSGISAPLISACPLVMGLLSSRYAHAKIGGNKRAVFMLLPDGSPPNHWLPKSANSMALSTVPYGAKSAPGITAYDVANYCHFHEVNNSWGSHGQTYKCMGYGGLSANQYVNTLDTQLAKANSFNTRFPIVRVGVNQKDGGFSVENGQVATFKKGASVLFNDIFGGVSVVENDRTYEKIFEMNARAVQSIQKQLTTEERVRMDTHLETMDGIRNNLEPSKGSSGGASCEVSDPGKVGSNIDIVEHGKMVADILISAFKCDLVSVASVMLSDDQCNWSIDSATRAKLKLPVGTPDTYHSAMHSLQQSTHAGLGKFLSVLSQVPAYFISKLISETNSTGAPLIESTLFCQLSDMGDGSDHSAGGAPWILAGPSRFDLGSFSNRGYSSNKDVLASIPGRMDLDGKLSG